MSGSMSTASPPSVGRFHFRPIEARRSTSGIRDAADGDRDGTGLQRSPAQPKALGCTAAAA